MAKAKSQPQSGFIGLWHIISMDAWDEDYFNEEVQAFVEFEANGTGHFQFGYVQGYMDWRPGTQDGRPCVEWTWEGTDGADMTELTGRGWAKNEDDQLHRMIVIHPGDESGFVAKRAKTPKRPKRK
jgi:hypothetical protein